IEGAGGSERVGENRMDGKSTALDATQELRTDDIVSPESEEDRVEHVPILTEIPYNRTMFRAYALAAFYGFLFLFIYFQTSADPLAEQRTWATVITFLGILPVMLFFWNEH